MACWEKRILFKIVELYKVFHTVANTKFLISNATSCLSFIFWILQRMVDTINAKYPIAFKRSFKFFFRSSCRKSKKDQRYDFH